MFVASNVGRCWEYRGDFDLQFPCPFLNDDSRRPGLLPSPRAAIFSAFFNEFIIVQWSFTRGR